MNGLTKETQEDQETIDATKSIPMNPLFLCDPRRKGVQSLGRVPRERMWLRAGERKAVVDEFGQGQGLDHCSHRLLRPKPAGQHRSASSEKGLFVCRKLALSRRSPAGQARLGTLQGTNPTT